MHRRRRRRHRRPILAAAAALISMIASSAVAMADTAVVQSRDLAPAEVRAHLKPVDPAIGACYLDAVGTHPAAAGSGKLEVVLSIHRKGLVDHIDVRAPGLPPKTVTKIDGCIRDALAGITFPARRTGTTAVVPYFWQKTAAVGAGPLESCWDAKGCKDSVDAPITKPTAEPPARQARRAPRAS